MELQTLLLSSYFVGFIYTGSKKSNGIHLFPLEIQKLLSFRAEIRDGLRPRGVRQGKSMLHINAYNSSVFN